MTEHLDARLAEIAAIDQQHAPSADLESRVLAAFDEHGRTAVPPRRASATWREGWRGWSVASAAVAACAALILVAGTPWRAPRAPGGSEAVQDLRDKPHRPGAAAPAPASALALPRPPSPAERTTAPEDGPRIATAAGTVEPRRREASGRRRLPPAVTRRGAARREVDRFIALGPDDGWGEREALQLTRMAVPRGVLVNLGLLREAAALGGPVQADVMIGEDGAARAIRIRDVEGE